MVYRRNNITSCWDKKITFFWYNNLLMYFTIINTFTCNWMDITKPMLNLHVLSIDDDFLAIIKHFKCFWTARFGYVGQKKRKIIVFQLILADFWLKILVNVHWMFTEFSKIAQKSHLPERCFSLIPRVSL